MPLGERPRTVAFGDNETFNILSVKGTLDIERYGRVNVDAVRPEFLYPDRRLLAAELNTGFLRRCVGGFRKVNFAEAATGRIYLRIESGTPAWVDRAALASAAADPDTRSGIMAVAPGALRGEVPGEPGPQYLRSGADTAPTLGEWGLRAPASLSS